MLARPRVATLRHKVPVAKTIASVVFQCHCWQDAESNVLASTALNLLRCLVDGKALSHYSRLQGLALSSKHHLKQAHTVVEVES